MYLLVSVRSWVTKEPKTKMPRTLYISLQSSINFSSMKPSIKISTPSAHHVPVVPQVLIESHIDPEFCTVYFVYVVKNKL